MRRVALTLVILASAGGVVAVSAAMGGASAPRAPILVSVGHVNRYPEASWTLPAGVEAVSVEVARSPRLAADGSFAGERGGEVLAGSALGPSETHWLSVEYPALSPGTYYVHVLGRDTSCASLVPADCGPAWSNILSFTIPNRRPRITSVKIKPSTGWRMYGWVRVCDDHQAPMTFTVVEHLSRVRPFVTARRRLHSSIHFFGCDSLEVAWRLAPSLRRAIRYGHRLTVTFWVTDPSGARSMKGVSQSWDVLD